MLSEVKWPRMTDRMCQRLLFPSSVSMSTFPRPIFLPISPASGMVVLNFAGVAASSAVDLSCSCRLGLWPANMWAFCWHMAWTSCKAGVRERSAEVVLRGVTSGLAGVVLQGVRLFPHLTGRPVRGVAPSAKTSSLDSLVHWWRCWRLLSVGSSSDWEPPSLSVESLCCRCKRERRLASAWFWVSVSLLEAESSSSWKEPSWSTEVSWDLSRVRELKPLSSYTDLDTEWGVSCTDAHFFLFNLEICNKIFKAKQIYTPDVFGCMCGWRRAQPT